MRSSFRELLGEHLFVVDRRAHTSWKVQSRQAPQSVEFSSLRTLKMKVLALCAILGLLGLTGKRHVQFETWIFSFCRSNIPDDSRLLVPSRTCPRCMGAGALLRMTWCMEVAIWDPSLIYIFARRILRGSHTAASDRQALLRILLCTVLFPLIWYAALSRWYNVVCYRWYKAKDRSISFSNCLRLSAILRRPRCFSWMRRSFHTVARDGRHIAMWEWNTLLHVSPSNDAKFRRSSEFSVLLQVQRRLTGWYHLLVCSYSFSPHGFYSYPLQVSWLLLDASLQTAFQRSGASDVCNVENGLATGLRDFGCMQSV